MTALEVLLVVLGVFYAFAGVVGVKAALTGRFLDLAMAAIEMKPPQRAETLRGIWLLAGAILVLAGGAALILRLEWAAYLFTVSALMQGAYLGLVAPRYFDVGDPPDAQGRQQTINAFLIYTAVTVLVLWAYRNGALIPFDAIMWPARAALAALVAGMTGYSAWKFASPIYRSRAADGLPEEPVLTEHTGVIPYERWRPLHESRAIVLFPEFASDPLWAHDPDLSGTIAPRDLPLSGALIRDLETWAQEFDSSYNPGDETHPHWSDAQYHDHRVRGLALARRLKAELPDRQIYVYDPDSGHIEITESGAG